MHAHLTAQPATATELTVHIDSITSTGAVHVYLYTGAEGFPKEEAAALHTGYPVEDKAQTAMNAKIRLPAGRRICTRNQSEHE